MTDEMTVKEIEEKLGFGDIFTLEEFRDFVKHGYFNGCDGDGYFHDGEKETRISIWSVNLFDKEYNKYPYVWWLNK